jgi:tetratricopeptide (TPR) repeat protein
LDSLVGWSKPSGATRKISFLVQSGVTDFEQAKKAFEDHDYASARELLEALQRTNSDEAVSAYLGITYFRLNEFELADTHLKKVHDAVQNDPKILHALALNLLFWGNSKKVLAKIKESRNYFTKFLEMLTNTKESIDKELALLNTLDGLAQTNLELKEFDLAEYYAQRILEQSQADDARGWRFIEKYALGLYVLAKVLAFTNVPSKLELAKTYFEDCKKIRENLYEAGHPEIGWVNTALAEVMYALSVFGNNLVGMDSNAFDLYKNSVDNQLKFNQQHRFGAVTSEQAISQTRELLDPLSKMFDIAKNQENLVIPLCDTWQTFKGSASALDAQYFVIEAQLLQIENRTLNEQELLEALQTYFEAARIQAASLHRDYLKLRALLSIQMS